MGDKIDLEKYKLLFEYQKEQYNAARERYTRLEDKSVKYFGAITLAISAFILLIRGTITKVVPPSQCIDYIIIVLIGLTILSMTITWSYTFRSLKLQDLIKMPFDNCVDEDFIRHKRSSLYRAYAKRYSKATNLVYEEYDKKLDFVKKSYLSIVISSCLFLVTLFFIFIQLWKG